MFDRARVARQAEEMATEGLRVLAIATRRLADLPADLSTAEQGMTFLGLIGLLDPPRPEARNAVAVCQSAGVHVVMITGDHASTAEAIARRLGIAPPDVPPLTGAELSHGSIERVSTHACRQATSFESSKRCRLAANSSP